MPKTSLLKDLAVKVRFETLAAMSLSVLIGCASLANAQTQTDQNQAAAPAPAQDEMAAAADSATMQQPVASTRDIAIPGPAGELSNLPPATIVTAQIDPLRSDGEMLADKLKAAGVKVEHRNFDGVTHEVFGMGTVVKDAKSAQAIVAERLQAAFAITTN